MHITARERILLTLLVHASASVSQIQLAEAASVSVRTIQRDLKRLERTVRKFGLELLRKKDHSVYLQGDRGDLLAHLQSMDPMEFTSEERQGVLLVRLLMISEPIKLFTLAAELGVTTATVSSDLDKTSEWLEAHGLDLIRKRGYGIEIQGLEKNKRRAMSGILSNHLTEETLYDAMYHEEVQHKVTDQLLHLVELPMVKKVLHTVQRVKEERLPHIADQSLIALVVHTTLALERLRQGELITMDPDQLEALEQTEEHEVARTIGKALEEAFDMKIPAEEIGYLVMHLRGASVSGKKEIPFEELNTELISRIKQLIRRIEEELDTELYEPSLIQDLLSHLKPALYRIRQGMTISNPLLERIRRDYEGLFSVTKKQASSIFSPLSIPDAEVGLLVLHFGSVLERRKRSLGLRALVICPSGIGSAKMLASRMTQRFPEITSITNASMFELNAYDEEAYDLVISTVKLEHTKKVFHVSPVLTEEDIQAIRSFIESYQTEHHEGREAFSTAGASATFEEMTMLGRMMNHFLRSIEITCSDDVWQGIGESLHSLERRGYVSQVENVQDALRQRENVGGLAIPETGLALYHTRSKAVNAPFFHILHLKENKKLMSMSNEEEMVKRILIMAAPESLQPLELAFMSYVSTLFIGSKEQTAVFRTGSKREVAQMLEQECRDYLSAFI